MSSRKFVYCENTEGGMDMFEIDETQTLISLRGWMSADCKADDTGLLKWMETATVGQWTDHRLGACFCVAGSQSAGELDLASELVDAAQGVIAEHDATRGQMRTASRDIERLRFAVKRSMSEADAPAKPVDKIGGTGGQGGSTKV